ncbi:hypothetical protein CYQ88_07755 [Hydrogenovibrio sp. SC-1]|uniref:M48 family metalloprotease n=1 Tax=Hydrogenovibrio sp. SC-1 TaxID=2065820 RepID=UPI000C7D9CB6|nr:M48 family metalloprotease [Hydrogenovibrio sp. SC-1]PLA74127.1 hypothetical protein CYQ88_07755 [Hydrogenovibrio sp. SC-1]
MNSTWRVSDSKLLKAGLVVLGMTVMSSGMSQPEGNFHKRLFATIPDAPYTEDDIATEILFGRELASKVLGKYPPVKNDQLNAYVNKVGQVVAQMSERSELKYRFIVLDTDIINAFAAPGGYIFITKGALNNIEDESELAAILAHEIGHVELRHYVKKVKLRSAKGNAEDSLGAVLSGGGRAATQAFNEALDETMEILFNKGLQSKKDEFEADRTSVFLLANAGYDPTALMRYFNRIEKNQSEQVQILSETHPPLTERINEMDTLIEQNGLSNINLAKLQERFNEYH